MSIPPRAGGVDQVSLRDGNDLLALHELDQKLWVALAMPVRVDKVRASMEDGESEIRVVGLSPIESRQVIF